MSYSLQTVQESASLSHEPAYAELDAISIEERELIREAVRAVRSMRYGSVLMTVHDGRLVEIQKTERIRRGPPKTAD